MKIENQSKSESLKLISIFLSSGGKMQDYKNTKYYKDENGRVWKMESYFSGPSVKLKLIGSYDQVLNVGVESMIYSSMTKIPNDQDYFIESLIKQFPFP